MQDAGVVIRSHRERVGAEARYWLGGAPPFLRPRFVDAEIVALAVAANLLKHHARGALVEQFDSVLAKIDTMLPEPLRDLLVRLDTYVMVRPQLGRVARWNAQVLLDLALAIPANRKCVIEYKAAGRAKSDTHTVHPYYLISIEGVFHLVAYSEERAGLRQFRLDRVARAASLARTFDRPAEYDYENLDVETIAERSFNSWLASGDMVAEDVVLEFSPAVAPTVADQVWHPSQKTERIKGGGLRVGMTVPITPDLESWILSYGPELMVLKPTSLAQRIARACEATARSY
jgi:predicted DNA-binding transcriptional regulator YafY